MVNEDSGGSIAKRFKEKYGAKLEFQGSERVRKKMGSLGEVWINP